MRLCLCQVPAVRKPFPLPGTRKHPLDTQMSRERLHQRQWMGQWSCCPAPHGQYPSRRDLRISWTSCGGALHGLRHLLLFTRDSPGQPYQEQSPLGTVTLMGTAQQMGKLHGLPVPSLGGGSGLVSPGAHEQECDSEGGLHNAMGHASQTHREMQVQNGATHGISCLAWWFCGRNSQAPRPWGSWRSGGI